MNIVKKETIELSNNERKAFDLVERILERVEFNAENPDTQNCARMALIHLNSFENYTEEIK